MREVGRGPDCFSKSTKPAPCNMKTDGLEDIFLMVSSCRGSRSGTHSFVVVACIPCIKQRWSVNADLLHMELGRKPIASSPLPGDVYKYFHGI